VSTAKFEWVLPPQSRVCRRCGVEKPRECFTLAGKICIQCKTQSSIASAELRERTKKAALRLAQKMTTLAYNQGIEEEFHL